MSENPSIDNVPLSPKSKLVNGVATVDFYDDVVSGYLDLTLNTYGAVTILDGSTQTSSKTDRCYVNFGSVSPFNFTLVTGTTGQAARLQAVAVINGTTESSSVHDFTVG